MPAIPRTEGVRFTTKCRYLTARCPSGCESWLHPRAVEAHLQPGRCRGKPWVDHVDDSALVPEPAAALFIERMPGMCKSNFFGFCEDQPPGSLVIPTDRVVPCESDTTTNNRRYHEARVFPVPAEVDPSKSVYMEEHIRIERGRDPAPRLHFFDDTSGPTGKIYVGYLGRHLPSPKTN